MKKFKVKAGVHFEDGVEYAKGEVVFSKRNLVEMFPEKFEDLGLASPEEIKKFEAKAAKKTKPAGAEDDWEKEKGE